MKKFLKNMNRGIALLVVVVIGFVGYVIYDNASFKANRPDIEKMLEDYCGQVGQMNLLPEEYRQQGSNIPQEALDQKQKENEAVIDRYWTEGGRGGWNSKSSVKNDLTTMMNIMRTTGGRILDFKLESRGINSIKKIAPNTAAVALDFYISFDAVGGGQYFNGFYTNDLQYFGNYYDSEETLNDGKVRTYTATQCTAELTVYKTSDGWKIRGITSLMTSNPHVKLKEEGTTSNEGGEYVG